MKCKLTINLFKTKKTPSKKNFASPSFIEISEFN